MASHRLLFLVAVSLLGQTAGATLPLPTYPQCGEPDRPDLCPSDLGEDWEKMATIPAHSRASIRPEELALGSGNGVDKAWRVTTGRFDVVLAIGDSGVAWHASATRRKFRLNAEELPYPQGADGNDAGMHDRNGDGLFNIDDWAEDPRVDPTAGQDRADGVLDPSDLIAVFSDGVDDDGNGYVDDICGWDFFEGDNDPYASLETDYGGHGQGVAEGAAAEGGDGGPIGVCPNCSILPVRLGDTFITDGVRVAQAVAYAADQGASAISLATGALSNAELTSAAMRYAWDQGLVVSSVAGDENGFHHNFPSVLPEALYTRSVRYDSAGSGGPVFSYFNTQNCNNFGARLDLVAASRVCATGAATAVTGVIGLIQSAALDVRGERLHAGEVVQLLLQTADDAWLDETDRAQARAYPTAEGWDPYTGYGRADAENAVAAVVAGEIPPWVRIDDPAWFDSIDVGLGSLTVHGSISAEHAAGFSWVVELGMGERPEDWQAVGTGEGDGRFDGALASVDLSDLDWTPVPEASRSEKLLERMDRVNGNALTLRLTVTDSEGRLAQARRQVFLEDDPDLLPGFPVQLTGSGEASPVLADLDGDGVYEIIVATGSGSVLALNGAGQALPGWPVQSESQRPTPAAPAWTEGGLPPVSETILSTPAVGDLDGDGSPEVIAAGVGGTISAWHADGSPVAGFPVATLGRDRADWGAGIFNFDQGVVAAVALSDIDEDGRLEVIVAGMDGRLYVLDHQGQDWGPYPISPCDPAICGVEGYRIVSSPTISDVDGDGDLDILFGSNETPEGLYFVVHAYDATTATPLPGWPLRGSGVISYSVVLPMIGEGHPSSLSLADLDGDGDLEIADPILLGQTAIRDHTGAVIATARGSSVDFGPGHNIDIGQAPGLLGFAGNSAWGDMDGDGLLDLVQGAAGVQYFLALADHGMVDYQQPVGGWSSAALTSGQLGMLPGFPRQIEDIQLLSAPAIADLSGDGRPEAIVGSAGYLLHAWDSEGVEPEGWPKSTGGWILGAPAVGDIDGDGYLDVVATTREGKVFAWTSRGRADQAVQWAGFRHDAWNTGNFEQPLSPQAGPREDTGEEQINPLPEEEGCCGKDGSKGALLLLPLLAVGVGRRRRPGPGARRGGR